MGSATRKKWRDTKKSWRSMPPWLSRRKLPLLIWSKPGASARSRISLRRPRRRTNEHAKLNCARRTYSAGSKRARRFPSSARGLRSERRAQLLLRNFLRRARFLFKVGFTVPAPRDARAPPSRLLLRHAVGEVLSLASLPPNSAWALAREFGFAPNSSPGSRRSLPSIFFSLFWRSWRSTNNFFRASCAGQYRHRAWLP